MADANFVQIAPLMRDPGVMEIKTPPKLNPIANGAMICGVDVGSTTVKYVLASPSGEVISQAYERHNTKQGEKVLQFLSRLEAQHDFTPQRDRIFLTGSGAGLIAPVVGAKVIQEVVAVAASVERLHPAVRFVSEIGGEDMKTIFFNGNGTTKSKQVLMQSACSGGTGTFIEKTARKLQIPPEALSEMHYTGHTLHKISSKCGIFAEADANTLLKAGVTVDEIIASLFEAVVYQNLATLTRGNTPSPEVLLLGGPNLFFKGLQEAWRLHLTHIWQERKILMPSGKAPEEYIVVPKDALYYAALGCIEVALGEPHTVGIYQGTKKLQWWIEEGQYEEKKKQGRGGLSDNEESLRTFIDVYSKMDATSSANVGLRAASATAEKKKLDRVLVGCDFGSTTAKAVCLSPDKELLFSCYALSKLGITGYGKDLLKGILGADCGVVETIAHASAGLHYFPDADCICDVGGVDVKIMILKNGTVSDFRLNSQCSSGNGAFLQGVAERFGIPLSEMADKAFLAQAMPQLSMGCGVFLQSDIVNQQRKGWQAEEILAALCSILPLNVWIYAGGMNNLGQVGKKFILQGGTHKNLAVVKTQVDFIRSKVPDADVVVHPYSGEAGAIGAALVSLDWWEKGGRSRFRGFEVIEKLTYATTTAKETVCNWCPVNCQRSFIDVELPGGMGREWSKVPLSLGWERVIVNNSCPKGLVEDLNEMKVIKAEIEKTKNAFPNIADMVRKEGFRRVSASA
jgi:activator of 2-hydroxyglutaryl-CoA dehydratase